MPLADILHMNIGDGDSSYANNSLFTKIEIQKAAPFIMRTIRSMANHDVFFDHCFRIADLGCSSGKNTLLIASNVINTIEEVYQENNRKIPQFEVCLNDLFGNDFYNVFKLLPDFYKTLRKDKGDKFSPCFVSAVPGSFYGRLFPDKSLHLVHSCYSIHWLSKVCHGLENNKLNIYIAKTSPLNVLQAYGNQFHTDFTKFLQLRFEELVCGGCMVLTLRSRSSLDPTGDDSNSFWDLLTISLLEMLKEGLVQESDIISFNIPFYFPHEDELRDIIQAEGPFSLDNIDVFELNWGQDDYTYMNEYTHESNHNQGKNTSNLIRAITESLFTSHFGNSIIDELFKKCEKNATEHLATNITRHLSVVVSLTKKMNDSVVHIILLVP
ncbi:benzoate carboxyl methyltransferase-like [Bidens hawaiensis]|uniref:benzoate carboxyl methyltransferase-like n=1 Tax=Bidens hawaiensis TaxID=980011 RepID=UPI00404A3D78